MTTVESPQAPAPVESPQSPAQPLETSAPPSPTASPQASSTTPAQTSSNIKAQVTKYFEMMTEVDGDSLEEAQDLTVPESPAWYYALAQAAARDAQVDPGDSEDRLAMVKTTRATRKLAAQTRSWARNRTATPVPLIQVFRRLLTVSSSRSM